MQHLHLESKQFSRKSTRHVPREYTLRHVHIPPSGGRPGLLLMEQKDGAGGTMLSASLLQSLLLWSGADATNLELRNSTTVISIWFHKT